MIMYELDLRDIEFCTYIKIMFKILKIQNKLEIFFCYFQQSKKV